MVRINSNHFFIRELTEFAEQSGCHVIEINMAQSDEEIMMDVETAKLESKDLYENGGKKQRTILILDECDSIASLPLDEKGNKTLEDGGNYKKLEAFLSNCSEEYKCTAFMTTNHPLNFESSLLDPKLIPIQVFLEPPGAENSAEIFKHYMKLSDQEIDYNKLGAEVMKFRENNEAVSAGRIEKIVDACYNAAKITGQKVTEQNLLDKMKEFGADIKKESFMAFIEDMAEMGKRFV